MMLGSEREGERVSYRPKFEDHLEELDGDHPEAGWNACAEAYEPIIELLERDNAQWKKDYAVVHEGYRDMIDMLEKQLADVQEQLLAALTANVKQSLESGPEGRVRE
jgi:hypothetical protein